MNFFEMNLEKQVNKSAPLADRLRPKTIEEFVGQDEIIGPGKYINRLLKANKIFSIIFTSLLFLSLIIITFFRLV